MFSAIVTIERTKENKKKKTYSLFYLSLSISSFPLIQSLRHYLLQLQRALTELQSLPRAGIWPELLRPDSGGPLPTLSCVASHRLPAFPLGD